MSVALVDFILVIQTDYVCAVFTVHFSNLDVQSNVLSFRFYYVSMCNFFLVTETTIKTEGTVAFPLLIETIIQIHLKETQCVQSTSYKTVSMSVRVVEI